MEQQILNVNYIAGKAHFIARPIPDVQFTLAGKSVRLQFEDPVLTVK